MKPKLTKRQKEILDFVADFISRLGYAPSIREIASAFGLSSTATVHQHLESLIAKGLLHKERGRSRSMEVAQAPSPGITAEASVLHSRVVEVPVLGIIAAGQPIESPGFLDPDDTVAIPESYLKAGEHFALRVRGDSMIDEGIHDGDTLIVKKQDRALPGQVVVALVNGEATVKFYYPKNGTVELRPANPRFAPIFVPESDVIIQGLVISLLRKF